MKAECFNNICFPLLSPILVCLVLVAKLCRTLATPWIVTCQIPLFMGFSRQEYWSGFPFPFPGDLPDPGIKPRSPALQADDLLTELWGKPILSLPCDKTCGEQVRPASDSEGWALLQQNICHDQYCQSLQECPAQSRSSKSVYWLRVNAG